jgi:predicted nucleic acid-binding protein
VILVDTNVLLDVVQDDPVWADWSQRQLDAASLKGSICINPVIYAELSIAFARIEELEAVVAEGGIEHKRYRARHCSWRPRYSCATGSGVAPR